MPTITFQPVLKEIREVLGSEFLAIPRFQRPYSWTSENLEDFWRDVVEDNDPGYFIGPMVAYDLEGRAGIVDGQQRITTVTLALRAVRNLFDEYTAPQLADAVHRYIEREDDESRRRFVLRAEAAHHYLATQLLSRVEMAPQSPSSEEERALKRAGDDIEAWIREVVMDLDSEPGEDGESPIVRRLREVRDKLLGLKVIWIQLDSEEDAYVVFETLNSRGKDLEVVDLLKKALLPDPWV